ncbi:MAG: hypothetical protein KDD04_06595 [Sinomicrobium sp.]|nr:hypothetical protein [Sinomicrobium sp.]
MNIQEALETLRRAGKGILIVDVPVKNYTKQELCNRWARSSTWFDKLLKDPDCLLEIERKGRKGRGNATAYSSTSVIQEEMRLQHSGKL